MSDLLNEASLVLIPSGIKASKVYAQIPEDGSGDMTFSRASDATRVNSLGLVEKVRTNLVFPSENFSAWNLFNSATISTNTTTAPDGTTTADTLTFGSSAISQVFSNQGDANNTSHTVSVWAKSSTSKKFRIKIANSTTGGDEYSSNLTTTSSWQRFEFTFICPITHIAFTNEAGGGAGSIDIWGAQNEVSDFGPTAYIPTTSSAVSVGSYSNIPRLNYQNGGGGCPSLLLEAQRTNLAVYSEQFNNSLWDNAGGAVVVANNAISPDGYQNADRATFGASSLILRQLVSGITSSTSYTLTAYVKKSASSPASNVRISVNNTATWSGAGSTKLALTDNWQRITLNWTANGTSLYFIIGAVDENGNADSSCYGNVDIWGAQLEAGSYVSSYIPTLGTSVTRVADECYKTGISSLIGQTEGTIFLDCVINTTESQDLLSIRPGGTSALAIGTASNLILGYVLEGATVIAMSFANYAINTRYKIALAYKNGDCAFYVNGTQADTDSTAFTFSTALSSLYLGQSQYFGKESFSDGQVVLFPTRLTNSQLAELTA